MVFLCILSITTMGIVYIIVYFKINIIKITKAQYFKYWAFNKTLVLEDKVKIFIEVLLLNVYV